MVVCVWCNYYHLKHNSKLKIRLKNRSFLTLLSLEKSKTSLLDVIKQDPLRSLIIIAHLHILSSKNKQAKLPLQIPEKEPFCNIITRAALKATPKDSRLEFWINRRHVVSFMRAISGWRWEENTCSKTCDPIRQKLEPVRGSSKGDWKWEWVMERVGWRDEERWKDKEGKKETESKRDLEELF